MPLDLVGPGSGLDYFLAVDILQKEFYAGTATTDVAKIPYWENLFPDATGLKPFGIGTRGHTAMQNIYDHFATNDINASYGICSMDILCGTRNAFSGEMAFSGSIPA